MDIERPDGPDVNRGTNVIVGGWIVTAIVGLVLVFRYSVKVWMYYILPKVSRPRYIWGSDDFFYLLGYICDVGFTTLTWKSWTWGLGRHFFYLSPTERSQALKWSFISQPLGIASSMWSRTGVLVFLYNCLARRSRKIRCIIIICGVTQIIVNISTILQIILQCGPHPYHLANRAMYFHYIWTPLPKDGSVVCHPRTVQTTIGYIQGAYDCAADLTLTFLAGYKIWRTAFTTANPGVGRKVSWIRRFRQIDTRVRNQRIRQSIFLCGPLLLSGIAAIIRTYLLTTIGSEFDFTWEVVSFIVWAKIENASIPIATIGPVFHQFLRTLADRKHGSTVYNHELSRQPPTMSDKSRGSGSQNSYKEHQTNDRPPTISGGTLTLTASDTSATTPTHCCNRCHSLKDAGGLLTLEITCDTANDGEDGHRC